MKKMVFPILVVLVLFSFAGCATFATNQEVPQKTIPIIGFVSGSLLPAGEEIASYMKFAGICIGYDDFVAAVQGKDYDVVEKTYLVIPLGKVSAISKGPAAE
jgi:hypothetical protein